jgi:predicted ester cyclase
MVGVRTTMHGVHTGGLFGIAPTGRQTEVRAHDFHQIADGRIVRIHHMEDWLSNSAALSVAGIGLRSPAGVIAD